MKLPKLLFKGHRHSEVEEELMHGVRIKVNTCAALRSSCRLLYAASGPRRQGTLERVGSMLSAWVSPRVPHDMDREELAVLRDLATTTKWRLRTEPGGVTDSSLLSELEVIEAVCEQALAGPHPHGAAQGDALG